MRRNLIVLVLFSGLFLACCSAKYTDEDAKMIYDLNNQVMELDSTVQCRDARIIILGVNIQERDSVLRLRGVNPDTCKWSRYYK